MPNCPICEIPAESEKIFAGGSRAEFVCPRCGHYQMDWNVKAIFTPADQDFRIQRAIVSHHIRSLQASGDVPLISRRDAEQVLDTYKLPEPSRQVDNLIQWIGRRSMKELREDFPIGPDCAMGVMGTVSTDFAKTVLNYMHDESGPKYLKMEGLGSKQTPRTFKLTVPGWTRFFELERNPSEDSDFAFMAMPFGKDEITQCHENCLKPAAQETGFTLAPVWDLSKAGLIDDHILVGIRRSKFMVADLTGLNHNVLWEAGFATGLGKPVIYTCSSTYSERVKRGEDVDGQGNKMKMPFDVEHRNTIFWKTPQDKTAADQLIATIRNSIPGAK